MTLSKNQREREKNREKGREKREVEGDRKKKREGKKGRNKEASTFLCWTLFCLCQPALSFPVLYMIWGGGGWGVIDWCRRHRP
jgi:hypothetical protein